MFHQGFLLRKQWDLVASWAGTNRVLLFPKAVRSDSAVFLEKVAGAITAASTMNTAKIPCGTGAGAGPGAGTGVGGED